MIIEAIWSVWYLEHLEVEPRSFCSETAYFYLTYNYWKDLESAKWSFFSSLKIPDVEGLVDEIKTISWSWILARNKKIAPLKLKNTHFQLNGQKYPCVA